MPLTLRDVLGASRTESEQGIGSDSKLQPDSPVRAFLKERQRFDLQDVRGFSYDIVNAVLAGDSSDVRDAIKWAEAFTEMRRSEDFIAICEAFKRIKNILLQAEEKHFRIGTPTSVPLSPAAQDLWSATQALKPKVEVLIKKRTYVAALTLVATLRPVVGAFFDKVMVLDPDLNVCGAHLAIIEDVLDWLRGIADFSEIVTS